MSKLRVSSFAISLDGYSAGPSQSLDNPMGMRGHELHAWQFATRTFQSLHGDGSAEGETGIDDDFVKRGFENVGAWIIGRNMFAHSRGAWTNDGWNGWWGPNPPYHVPVFILTHHPRPSISMEGGTTFHFVTEGIEAALDQAKKAANGKDVRLGGGTATIRDYLKAGLVDELHLVISPCLLGSGEHLLYGLDLPKLGYHCHEHVSSEHATHVVLKK